MKVNLKNNLIFIQNYKTKELKYNFFELKVINIKKYNFYFIFIILLIINIIFLFININCLIIQNICLIKIKNKNLFNQFKNVDIFNINSIFKCFSNISIYLNSKYKEKILEKKEKLYNESLKQKINGKKIINIYSVGSTSIYYTNRLRNDIKKGLENKYIFNFTSINPDYLIYDINNCEYLNSKYNNTIKIAYFTENQIPDFNKADYAIGFHNINYLDRYFKKTTLIWKFEKEYLKIKSNNFRLERERVLRNKKREKFCAAVISNGRYTNGFRKRFIKELNKYKIVDMGGKYMNNIGKIVKNKIKFLSSYKFSIAMENSEGQGYISEKILDSFIAGTIPIYYGGYMIDEFFNPKSFILIRDEKDLKEKIEYIKKIDNDDTLYQKLLKENLFIDDNLPIIIQKEKIKFFDNIFEQEKSYAKRIDNYHFNINNFNK